MSVDQAYTGEQLATDAQAHGIRLEVAKLHLMGFTVLLAHRSIIFMVPDA